MQVVWTQLLFIILAIPEFTWKESKRLCYYLIQQKHISAKDTETEKGDFMYAVHGSTGAVC